MSVADPYADGCSRRWGSTRMGLAWAMMGLGGDGAARLHREGERGGVAQLRREVVRDAKERRIDMGMQARKEEESCGFFF